MAKSKKQQSVLQEAQSLIHGARQKTYGSPLKNWQRTAAIWSIVLGVEVTPRQAVMCMIGTKMARQVHKPTRDNIVDICGYAGLDELIESEEEIAKIMAQLA